MKTRQTTFSLRQDGKRSVGEGAYLVRLTPKGERYVQLDRDGYFDSLHADEEAARRTLAKLATAAEALLQAERLAGDQG